MPTFFPSAFFRSPSVRTTGLVLGLIFAVIGWADRAAGDTENSSLQFRISQVAGGLETLTFDRGSTKLKPGLGGFKVTDAKTHAPLVWKSGSVTSPKDRAIFEGVLVESMGLHAEFVAKAGYLLVTGEIQNLRPEERGMIVEYTLPVAGENLLFGNELNKIVRLEDREIEGNVYPLAAIAGGDGAVAMAIPPTAPREFGMVGAPGGLTVRFYLGLSPATKRFSNRASFEFIIYPVEQTSGFRSALSKYYTFFPDYYSNRSGHDGMYLFLAEDGKEPNPPDLDYYGYDTIETQALWFKEQLARDKQHGILSSPYMIVGQREIKFLKTLPRTYDEAMAAYARWTVADQAGHAITKENEAAGGDLNLRIEVDSSTCTTADGKLAITLRKTPWGENSVSFKTNPNPDLFADTHDQSVGKNALRLIDKWIQLYPDLAGATIDSLGSNWPGIFNYRPDHFRYARYPLTCDPDGRVALHNEISHYEFLESLRNQLRSEPDGKERYIVANGIYSFLPPSTPAQHYRNGTMKDRVRLGRFFLAAMLDFAVSEPGITATQDSLEFMRVAMGRKIYSPTNARWDDEEKVKKWINLCLCYDLFGVNTRRYDEQIQYYYPDGYQRDKKLFDWFVPKARLLARAGWEPFTGASVNGEKMLLERYGSGKVTYFVVMSSATRSQRCTLTLDLAALSLNQDAGKKIEVEELAQGATLTLAEPNQITWEAQPFKTCIIAVR